jgi:hypothetical protein
MSRGRQKATKLVVAALTLVSSMIAAFPASAHDQACPHSWRPISVDKGMSGDANGDGLVCVKTVAGNGNTSGSNVKDNHDHLK